MLNYYEIVEDKLNSLKESGNYRIFLDVEKNTQTFPHFQFTLDEKRYKATNWCSNDYLVVVVLEIFLELQHIIKI